MKKVLLIFYSFAPQNNCAAIPNTKLVKYLEREPVELTLITNALLPSMAVDESLLPNNVKRIRRFTVHRSQLYDRTLGAQDRRITNSGAKLKMKSETRPLRAWAVAHIKNTFFTVSAVDWEISARKVIRENLKGEHFDVVYSSYPGLEPMHIAQYVKRIGMADKWIADFRDPLCYDIFEKTSFSRDRRTQVRIERAADLVTVVSEGAMEKFRDPSVPDEKLVYIPNGYDPDDLPAQESKVSSGALRLFYAGSLYGGKRDMSPIFRAVRELTDAGEIQDGQIQVEYAGNEWPTMERFAQQYDLTHVCKNYGFITHARVLELMSEIDCSIVSTQNTKKDQGVVTGKLFELLMAEKQIIAIVTGDLPNSELGNIVKECRGGVVYEEATASEDYIKLKQWILDACRKKAEEGALPNTIDQEARERYSYPKLAHQLYELIESV